MRADDDQEDEASEAEAAPEKGADGTLSVMGIDRDADATAASDASIATTRTGSQLTAFTVLVAMVRRERVPARVVPREVLSSLLVSSWG